MAAMIAENLEVCVDCAQISANDELGQGDDDADRRHAHRMALQWPDGDIVLACPEDCDGFFSSRPCDGCGDQLAGDRHPAVVFARSLPRC